MPKYEVKFSETLQNSYSPTENQDGTFTFFGVLNAGNVEDNYKFVQDKFSFVVANENASIKEIVQAQEAAAALFVGKNYPNA